MIAKEVVVALVEVDVMTTVVVVAVTAPLKVPEKEPETLLLVMVDPVMLTLDRVSILFMSEIACHKLCTSAS